MVAFTIPSIHCTRKTQKHYSFQLKHKAEVGNIFMDNPDGSILFHAKSILLLNSLLQMNSVPKTDLQSLISQPIAQLLRSSK